MKTLTFTSEYEWLEQRRGKATGSRVKKLIPGPRTQGRTEEWYELAAEMLASPVPPRVNATDWGHGLEIHAIMRFETETQQKVLTDKIMWISEEDESIAISPDGVVASRIANTEAIECKCLFPKNHLQILLDREVPKEYRQQVLWYFAVNDKLKKLHFIAYCPLFFDPKLQYMCITVTRKDVADEVAQLKAKVLEEVGYARDLVQGLT